MEIWRDAEGDCERGTRERIELERGTEGEIGERGRALERQGDERGREMDGGKEGEG